ncbi:hypothetical protein ACFLSQ_11290 [Bacteroidota bacterium]
MDCLIDIIIIYKELIVSIVTVLAGIAAIIAAIIAIPGLWKWKKQLKGTEEYQAGKELMKLTFKVRDYIDYVRAPVKTFKQKEGESGLEAMRRGYQERFQKIVKLTEQIHDAQSEAEFHWGDEIKDLNYPVWQKIVDLLSTIQYYLSDEESYKAIKKDKDAWDMLVKTSEDKYGKELNGMIEKLHEFINKKIN